GGGAAGGGGTVAAEVRVEDREGDAIQGSAGGEAGVARGGACPRRVPFFGVRRFPAALISLRKRNQSGGKAPHSKKGLGDACMGQVAKRFPERVPGNTAVLQELTTERRPHPPQR